MCIRVQERSLRYNQANILFLALRIQFTKSNSISRLCSEISSKLRPKSNRSCAQSRASWQYNREIPQVYPSIEESNDSTRINRAMSLPKHNEPRDYSLRTMLLKFPNESLLLNRPSVYEIVARSILARIYQPNMTQRPSLTILKRTWQTTPDSRPLACIIPQRVGMISPPNPANYNQG